MCNWRKSAFPARFCRSARQDESAVARPLELPDYNPKLDTLSSFTEDAKLCQMHEMYPAGAAGQIDVIASDLPRPELCHIMCS